MVSPMLVGFDHLAILLTKILDIFITSELHRNVRNATLKTTTGNVSLVHHDTICRSRRKESQAVGHLGRGRVVVEGDVGQEIAEDGEQQGDVPKPVSGFVFSQPCLANVVRWGVASGVWISQIAPNGYHVPLAEAAHNHKGNLPSKPSKSI